MFAGLTAVSGCRKNADATQVADNSGPDPADVNQAPVGAGQPSTAPQPSRTRVLGQSQSAQPQQTTESYPQQTPIERAPDPENYTPPQGSQNDQAYQPGDENFDQTVDQYASEPPPPLPVYEQPPCPEPNYLWTPGYWSYAPAGYFWVPGAWAAPPYYGALWTPGYWGVYGGRYGFHRGFWGLHIGFYGGIAYGFGYTGSGYHGGYWSGNNFYYNRAVNRVNVTNIHNTYVRNVTMVVNNRISYNGRGGVQARPAAYEVAAMREQHTPPMAAQVQLREQSQQNRQQFFNENKGRPAAVVAARPLVADGGIAAPQREGVQRQAVQQGIRPEAQGVRAEAQAGRTAQGGSGNAQPQRNEPQQRNESPQRDVQSEQRNQQEQQRNELQQRSAQQQEQQRNLQVQHNQQQQLQQRNDQQRSQQERSQVPTRTDQPRQPRVQEQRQPQPQAQQPSVEPQRVAPQPQPHAQPRPEARPEERPHPEGRPPR